MDTTMSNDTVHISRSMYPCNNFGAFSQHWPRNASSLLISSFSLIWVLCSICFNRFIILTAATPKLSARVCMFTCEQLLALQIQVLIIRIRQRNGNTYKEKRKIETREAGTEFIFAPLVLTCISWMTMTMMMMTVTTRNTSCRCAVPDILARTLPLPGTGKMTRSVPATRLWRSKWLTMLATRS